MKQHEVVWLTVKKDTTLEHVSQWTDLGWNERPGYYCEEWSSYETAKKVVANFANPDQYKIVKFERILTIEEVSI